MKYFLFGIEKAYLVTGSIGFIFVGISIITSGSMVSGDRMRANFATESKEDRTERNRRTLITLLIGLPNIITSGLLYYVFP
ncbi:DUF5316 domain-containing protein [Lederbergia wuyishanensis]|uniref:Uncharacterized protein n=1 Tax=Lederbergia wuyishanensis TaxID=1347903 RepID=A0ABU0D708_9BACI|nr:DUF5316 domain-containing protein [Lederbergia wuyishanensis]MCJ8008881.1 DUF5316 domain-containing protein [Lederbergia wuyishanensis]MDQ0344204.1 hypothetical protein [Lederbergia wuyishanensis]